MECNFFADLQRQYNTKLDDDNFVHTQSDHNADIDCKRQSESDSVLDIYGHAQLQFERDSDMD
jgi:hypothetical protein